MNGSPLRVLAVAASALAPTGFVVEASPGWADAAERLAGADRFDLVLVDGDAAPASTAKIAAIADRVALVVVLANPDAEHAPAWLHHGADDVVGRAELAGAAGWRRLRFAVERRRRLDGRQGGHSIDPATGLPHRQQLVEHLSQLLALREREPSPMALLAFRIEGLRPSRGGAEAVDADTLRRKIAVRLRAGVRASDVVAAIDDDAYAVLLGSILTPADGERVALKLVAALLAPFMVGAIERSVAVALGIAHSPGDGNDAELLLRRAVSLAAAAAATSPHGLATTRDGAGRRRAAANDDR
ncbi:MAG TPA: diguanylate cyclase [Caldimonas sp.]|nr:diguanylate cyclase [Caldimonas sp.]HEX4235355.1 diguanylate cyclase [Caldimonas sp.]